MRTVYPDSGIGSSAFSTRSVYNAFGYLKEIRAWLDADTGRLLRATIDRGSVLVMPFKVQDLSYSYDRVGNVNRRFDAATNREEQKRRAEKGSCFTFYLAPTLGMGSGFYLSKHIGLARRKVKGKA